jgi:uracil-DNA glycosylase
VALISQAPGRLAHQSGIAWADPGGRRLRAWLGMADAEFFASPHLAILPMGLCYPGKGRGGDRPPQPVCAPNWQGPLLALMPDLRLRLLIGAYAQRYYLGTRRRTTLSATVRAFPEYLSDFFPLPHPSPRNRGWVRDRPWFAAEVLPALRRAVARALATG